MVRAAGVAALLAMTGLLACSDSKAPQRPGVSSVGSGAGGAEIIGAGGSNPGSGGTGVTIISGESGAPPPNPSDFEACGADRRTAQPTQIDVYIMLDQSGSMTLDGNRWGPVSAALEAFVADPSSAGLGIAIQYFPIGMDDVAKCDVNAYAKPDVPMGLLPQQAGAIKASIDAHNFTINEARDVVHSGTPTRPALEGAVQYIQSWMMAHPTHTGVVLLASDGLPSSGLCEPDKIRDVVAVATMAAQSTSPVPTYVIGIGALGSLNEIAQAGTGHDAFAIDGTGVSTQKDFLDALNAIRATVLPCDYPIPSPEGGALDPLRVNVEYTAGGTGLTTVIGKAHDKAACQGDGWYYDDATHPTKVVMCATTCAKLQQDRAAGISIVFGCQSVIAN